MERVIHQPINPFAELENSSATARFLILTAALIFAIFQSAKTTRSDPFRGTAGFSFQNSFFL